MEKLDARRMLCPMPVIKTQEKIATLADGVLLEVECTDPGAMYDIPVWCKVHGHEVVSKHQEGRQVLIQIRVKKS